MKGIGRFELYLCYAIAVLALGIFVLTRLQAFEGWLLVPAAGSESVAVRPAAGFSLTPMQRNTPPDALLVDHPATYRRHLDPDRAYDAAQLPFHIAGVAASGGTALRLEDPNADSNQHVDLAGDATFRWKHWRLRRAPEQPAAGKYQVLVVTRVALTPTQWAGATIFVLGVLGFAGTRMIWNRPARIHGA